MECHPCYQWLLKVVSPYLENWPDVDVDVKQRFQFGGIGALFGHEIDVLVTPDPLHKPGLHFEAVFDIIAADLEPKPAAQTYRKFLKDHHVAASTSAMFEDLARNLVIPHQLGMTTVLVVPDGAREVLREDWELEGRGEAHVDHVTDDLTGFLQAIAQAQ